MANLFQSVEDNGTHIRVTIGNIPQDSKIYDLQKSTFSLQKILQDDSLVLSDINNIVTLIYDNVEEPVSTDIDDLRDQIMAMLVSGGIGFLASVFEDVTFREVLDSGFTYIGTAVPDSVTGDAVWKITRITDADNTVLFADGDADFDNIFDDVLSLSYS